MLWSAFVLGPELFRKTPWRNPRVLHTTPSLAQPLCTTLGTEEFRIQHSRYIYPPLGPVPIVECPNALEIPRRVESPGDFRGMQGFRTAANRSYLHDFFTHLFSTWFSTSIFYRLRPILDPILGLCWELFGYIFAFKLRSYLEVVFLSILFDC